MIRLLRAFAWVRWRLVVNAFKATRSRDPMERVSRVASVLVPLLAVVVGIPACAAFTSLAFWAGRVLGRTGQAPDLVVILTAALLGLALVILCIGEMVSASREPLLPSARLALLPVSYRRIHAVGIASEALSDPWIVVLLPPLAAMALGLATTGAWLAAALAGVAGVLVVGILAILPLLLGEALQLVYRNRRRGEIFTLVGGLILSFIGFLPLALTVGQHGDDRGRGAVPETTQRAGDPAAPSAPGTAAELERAPPRQGEGEAPEEERGRAGRSSSKRGGKEQDLDTWILLGVVLALPTGLYVRTLEGAAEGRVWEAFLALLGLAASAGVAFGVSAWIGRRLLETPAGGARRIGSNSDRWSRLPLLSEPVSAAARVHVKTVLRTLQGKYAVYVPPLFMAIFFVAVSRTRLVPLPEALLRFSPALGLIACGFLLLSQQRLLLNLFAIDGAGLTLEFLSPLSAAEIVHGKWAASALLYALPSLLILAAGAALLPPAAPLLWLAAAVSAAGFFLTYVPLALLLSAAFPTTADLGRFGKGSQPSGTAGFIGVMLALPVVGLPLALGALGLLGLGSALYALLLAVAWTGLAAAIQAPLLALAARLVERRRENLALVASGR